MYRNIVPRTGRILAASVASKRAAIPSRNMLMARSFHSYRPVLQQERPPVTPEDLGALGKALQDNPELLRRFTEVVDYLQEHELIKPGKQPTMMDVMKIVSKKEARDKLAAFQQAANDAGIDLNSEEIQNLLKNLSKKTGQE